MRSILQDFKLATGALVVAEPALSRRYSKRRGDVAAFCGQPCSVAPLLRCTLGFLRRNSPLRSDNAQMAVRSFFPPCLVMDYPRPLRRVRGMSGASMPEPLSLATPLWNTITPSKHARFVRSESANRLSNVATAVSGCRNPSHVPKEQPHAAQCRSSQARL